MNQEQREARLTAYALNDPGLSSAERSEIESLIVTDAEARQAVEETRHLSRLLTNGLAAEQAATPVTAVTIPASSRPKTKSFARIFQLVAASIVVLAVASTTMIVRANRKAENERVAEAEQLAQLEKEE